MKPVADLRMGGRYRLVSRIAVGGMGEVWLGHDEALARDVAVKVLREEFAGDAGFLERFRTEARNGAHLSHPNIAQLYDYGEQEGSGFLVMELVLGEPMSDLLDRQPVLPTLRLLPILAQTARALHAAHAGGVVHRDVKPGNILLARSGRVKITDFGISTATNQVPMTSSGMVMGTAQYLSPEQAMGRAATPASDVYSLGIVAYEALVGHRPFTGPTAVDIAIAHVNTAVPALPSDVDPDLSALVMRMLAKDPEKRPRSAASLARALDDLLDRTPPGGVPAATGRHSRAIDVLHAEESEARRRGPVVPVPGRVETVPVPADRAATRVGGSSARVGGAPAAGSLGAGAAPPARHAAATLTPPEAVPTSAAPPTTDAVGGAAPDRTSPSGSTAQQRPDVVGRAGPGAVESAPHRAGGDLPGTDPSGPDPSRPDLSGTDRAGTDRAASTVDPLEPFDPAELGLPRPVDDGPRAPALAAPVVPAPPVIAPGSGPGPDGRSARRPGTRTGATVRSTTVRRTSTTTGLRWGQVSRPLLALVLMVVFALLGAAFADRLWGPSRAEPGPAQDARPVVSTSAASAPASGTIDAELPGDPTVTTTTTARGQ